ncbi:LysR family transcriptional regulator [Streptomyces sp. NPDC057575]|uniref:helix-turn-helix domain-containing protein n=1 Tax=unclassified Streptomyces TaxID=2593676 RepID=UPI00369B28FD
MQRLERGLGVRLFDRGPGRVSLTAAGRGVRRGCATCPRCPARGRRTGAASRRWPGGRCSSGLRQYPQSPLSAWTAPGGHRGNVRTTHSSVSGFAGRPR